MRTNLADEEAKLDSAQLKVITFITANMGLSCTLMFGALALGRGVFHAKAWNLYVFYFPTLIVICVGFLMRMAVASRRIRSWKWDKLMIHSKGRVLKTDVLKVEDLLKLLAGDRNRLGRHLGHFVDIEHRVRDLLRSLEDVYADDDKLYLRFAIGFFFITVSVFSALVICMDMLPPHSSTPVSSSTRVFYVWLQMEASSTVLRNRNHLSYNICYGLKNLSFTII